MTDFIFMVRDSS
ncbi:hypothetical protein USDA257_c11450 [Sinorhizobium fredii USDA 257]|nr:hypothetical protein USDA257_c11450 [Sinorhizobium fredii USDA 257]